MSRDRFVVDLVDIVVACAVAKSSPCVVVGVNPVLVPKNTLPPVRFVVAWIMHVAMIEVAGTIDANEKLVDVAAVPADSILN